MRPADGRLPLPAVGLALLTLVVVGTVAGGARARAMIVATRDDVGARLRLADLELRFLPVRGGFTRGLALPSGVAEVEERALALGRLSAGGLQGLPTLVQVLPEAGAPRLSALELRPGGRFPGAQEAAVVVDRSLEDLHGLGPGSSVTLSVEGETRVLPVVGVSLSPEHLLAPVHPAYPLPLKGSAGVVAISPAAARGSARAGQVNSLLVRLEPGAEADRVERALRAALPVTVTEALGREEAPSRRLTAFLLAQLDVYLPAMVAVFALAGVLLLALLVSRRVDARRREIGLRLALGHAPARIAASFLATPVAAAAAGATVGLAASGPAARATAGAWARSMGYAPLVPGPWPVVPASAAALACLAVAASAALASAWSLARRSPALLLRESVLDARRPIGPLARGLTRLAERLGLPPAGVLAVAGVARRRRESLTAILCGALLTAMVLAFAALHVAHRREAVATLARSTLTATVHLARPVAVAEVPALAAPLHGVAEALVAGPVQVVSGAGTRAQRLLGVAPGPWLASQPLATGRGISRPGAAEALVDRWLARAAGVGVGDRLTLYPARDAPEGVEVTVAGVLDGMSMGRLLVPLEVGQQALGLAGLATGFLASSPLEGAALEDALAAVPGADVALSRERALTYVDGAFDGSLEVLLLGLLTAAATALVVLGVIAAQERRERAPESRLLAALGWSRGARAGVTLGEGALRGLSALLLGVLLAWPAAQAFLDRVERANGYRIPVLRR